MMPLDPRFHGDDNTVHGDDNTEHPLCHSRLFFVIPALFMSFPPFLCHSRLSYVIPA